MVVELIIPIAAWMIFMEMNSSQDAIWSNSNITVKNKDRLHNQDAFGVFFIGIALAYAYKGISLDSLALALFFFFSRSGYFSWRLNMKRIKAGLQIKWNHLGKGRWDKIFRGFPTTYFIACFLGMTLTLIYLLWSYR